MGIGTIISVLSSIPWGQVVDNAPKVVEGATKLWHGVSRKKPEPAVNTKDHVSNIVASADAQALKDHLLTIEERLLNIQEQMRASSELIKSLAEQNAQLVQKIEIIQTRLFRLAVFCVALTLAMAWVYLK